MSSVLIAYATTEGQTAKISASLAERIGNPGHAVDLVDLESRTSGLDVSGYDGVIVAASVHAGKHQESVLRFVAEHAEAFGDKVTAFLSVSMSAASATETGRERAGEQAASFLESVEWRPDFVETVAGAFRYSSFSRGWRWIIGVSQRIFNKELRRQGWPNLTGDGEYTDWAALQKFGDSFADAL